MPYVAAPPNLGGFNPGRGQTNAPTCAGGWHNSAPATEVAGNTYKDRLRRLRGAAVGRLGNRCTRLEPPRSAITEVTSCSYTSRSRDKAMPRAGAYLMTICTTGG